MFISFRVTRKGVVNAIVVAILACLFFMGMDGVDHFSSDWNRVTGASMPNSSLLREKVGYVRSGLPDEGEEFLARAEANANKSSSLMDVVRGVADLVRSDATAANTAPAYGSFDNQESPYDRIAD